MDTLNKKKGNKYLSLVSTDKSKEVLTKYTKSQIKKMINLVIMMKNI